VTAVDATASHTERDAQRGQDLPLGLPAPGHRLQAGVDHGHQPGTGSSGRGSRSPHGTSVGPRLCTSCTQKMSAVLVEQCLQVWQALYSPGQFQAVLRCCSVNTALANRRNFASRSAS
jgi:hypothetical protein